MCSNEAGRLLIVDDVAEDRESLARRFQRVGYETVEAGGGASALQLIRDQTFDVVLLDIVMPDVDGMEVLRRVRQTLAQCELPIVMVTAKTTTEDVVAALELGANDYLTKPVDMAIAKARVLAQVARKRAEDASRAARAEIQETVKRLQAALEASDAATRAKSEFLANMSHEIRTPLNGVVGVVDVLARSERDPERLRLLEIVRASGMTLERILSDVLDVSRLESGAVEIETRPFSVAKVLEETIALFAARALDKGIDLTLQVEPALARPLLGDGVRVKQILANLVSNAIKFTRAGEVSVRGALAPVDSPVDGGPRVRIEVRDTGVGFDASDKARIFGRFQQADGSITRRFGGTGLGLSISRQLAELMQGGLDCSSEPGRGSVFTLTIPARFDTAAGPAVESPVEETPAALPDPARPLQVLLADDHPVNRQVVELMLSGAPVELTSVEDGQAALDAFGRQAFDLVLMDMQMPVMDGLTAVTRIREIDAARGERTPIAMLTANALHEHAEAARAAGADVHLTKPLRAAQLLALIAPLLERCAESRADPGADQRRSAVG